MNDKDQEFYEEGALKIINELESQSLSSKRASSRISEFSVQMQQCCLKVCLRNVFCCETFRRSSSQLDLSDQWKEYLKDAIVEFEAQPYFKKVHKYALKQIKGKSEQIKKFQQEVFDLGAQVSQTSSPNQGYQEQVNNAMNDSMTIKDSILSETGQQFMSSIQPRETPINSVYSHQKTQESPRKQLMMIQDDLTPLELSVYQLIEQQIQSEDHPIKIYSQCFAEQFCKNYQKYVNFKNPRQTRDLLNRISRKNQAFRQSLREMNDQHPEQVIATWNLSPWEEPPQDFTSAVLQEVKVFLGVMHFTLLKFYEQSQNVISSLIEDLHKLICQTFLKEKVYRIIVAFNRISNRQQDKEIRKKMRSLVRITPQEVGIEKLLLLNQQTSVIDIVQQQNLRLSQGIQQTYQSRNDRDDEDDMNPLRDDDMDIQYTEDANFDFLIDEAVILERLKNKPYIEAINMLRNIQEVQSPIAKLYLLDEVKKCVMQQVEQFWEGIQFQDDKLTLGTDQLLPIFLFIIIKAQIPDLYSQVKYIEKYCSEYTLYTSKQGHTLITVNQALEILKVLEWEKLKKDPEYVKNVIIDFCMIEQGKQNMNDMTHMSHDTSFNVFFSGSQELFGKNRGSDVSSKRGSDNFSGGRKIVKSSYLISSSQK